MTFKIGDRVNKAKGYSFPGYVVSVFEKLDGQVRYVVEFSSHNTDAGRGMLHIFSHKDLVRGAP